jgi:hypothetical protein
LRHAKLFSRQGARADRAQRVPAILVVLMEQEKMRLPFFYDKVKSMQSAERPGRTG